MLVSVSRHDWKDSAELLAKNAKTSPEFVIQMNCNSHVSKIITPHDLRDEHRSCRKSGTGQIIHTITSWLKQNLTLLSHSAS
jgi:hypothetical protein